MAMNLEPWINALRSGNFPQTQGTLCDTRGFCCLGVAAVIFKISTPNEMRDSEDCEGPRWVYDQLRTSIDGNIIAEGIFLNDAGRSFSEIADMIEKELANAAA